ncbi:MAG: hypothetical protein HYT85_13185 [candidate division NC10 bacterium]|nr:hypothetical protein [candidate division NC10 bacterium]MBI2116024.1 hypothetical protein [candidate division NC10 bacterium]MBI3085204.1 hypothetical protein [candidate division NC10 bacterium]
MPTSVFLPVTVDKSHLMKDAPRDPRKAFDRQSKLLRDAFTDNQDHATANERK